MIKVNVLVDKNVKEINIIPRSINNNYYTETLQTIGLYSDILIIPDTYLDSKEKLFSFSSIDKSYFEEYLIDLECYEYISHDGLIYGIVVYDKEKEKIVLFYVGEMEVKDLVVILKAKLPRYMIPNKVEKLEKMPLTANGKLDRVYLKNYYKENN